ncbi:helix-turn-helix domain-containing protein [Aurantimicrobium minutum]|uniref:helix-turn-helix domain-containing protein n=1 Tax=Aurantimicrobium minutum TaxID=708131 RepID=UPI0024739E9C|nr:helix-turn-helix domain-containing protein [Aurantimicrobium minutum]MDH6422939.1 DNA-binding XRE family transcriptional regulator [Aurantimicrobium minutum]
MGKKQQTIPYENFMKEIRESWTEEDWKIYDAVSADFQKEMRDRAELGAALQSARKARSLTQPKLSLLADVQQAEISRIERGVGNPTATTLFRLTDALGLKLALIPVEKKN